MQKFIERIKHAWDSQYAWTREPLFFKAFMVVLTSLYGLFKLIFAIVTGITSPLWIVPYAIYWTNKNK